MEEFSLNSLEVIHSKKRKNIGISVYRNGLVKVRVPFYIKQNEISDVIERKKKWIFGKIKFFQNNQINEVVAKKYENGEKFYYLGSEYILNIIESNKTSIKIVDNYIFLYKSLKKHAKNILEKFFLEQAKVVFNERLKICFGKFLLLYSFEIPILKLRKMKARWGSMSSRNIMTLNTYLIYTKIEVIDYVIFHELCHLRYKGHGKRFYQLQEKLVPNFNELKGYLKYFSPLLRLK